MNPDQGTELRNGKIINSSPETSSPADPDMAQTSSNDSYTNETSDISSQLSEIRENYERKINDLQSEFSQLKDLMMAVISKIDSTDRLSSLKGPSKPAHSGLDTRISVRICTDLYRFTGSAQHGIPSTTRSLYLNIYSMLIKKTLSL